MSSNMTESMKISEVQTVNALEFAENGFTEGVNIDIQGKASNRYACNLCDFKNTDKGGMKRHIHAKHRPGGLKRQEHDDNLDYEGEEKKAKTDNFEPDTTSTQKPSASHKLNLTVSAYSNESLLNLLDDKYEFITDDAGIAEPENLVDITMQYDQNNDLITAVEDAVQDADVALMSIRMSKLEEELKLKTLECTEKEGTIEEILNENYTLKEETSKLKDETKVKDEVNESNLGRMNDLEETLKKKTHRVDILEPLVNKMMHEIKLYKSNKNDPTANDVKHEDSEVRKLKLEIKAKNQAVKLLNEQKSTLANEIRDLQEKANNGQNKDIIDKCIKLTADASTKNNEIKSLERENKKLVETLANLQTKLNETNNKLAEAQVSNTRLKEFNAQMFELCKGTKLVDNLEKEHAKDIEEQKVTFDEHKPKETRKESMKNSPVNQRNKKVDKKCWHYENGFCKKGAACNFLHPTEICHYFSKYGQCPQGLVCSLRHPLRICMSFMEGGCHMGNMCVLQHPVNSSPTRSSLNSPNLSQYSHPTPSRETYVQHNLSNPAYSKQSFPFFPTQQHRQPQPFAAPPQHIPRQPFGGQNGLSGRLQTPPQPSFNQNVPNESYGTRGSPSGHNGNNQQQQGFW